jgi:hypothetical protein
MQTVATTTEAVLAAVDSRRTQCRTDFYVGEWHLIRNNRDEARRRLQLASAKQCDFIHPTYQGAVAELRAIAAVAYDHERRVAPINRVQAL